MKISKNTLGMFLSSIIIIYNTKCTLKREALGADNEIRVICSEVDKVKIRNYLSMIFTDTIYTPEPEPYYNLKFSSPENYKKLKDQSQIVIAALDRNPNNTGYILMKKILSEEKFNYTEKIDPIILSENIYAKKQLFMIINAKNEDTLISVINKKKNYIREQFHRQFVDRQTRYLFGDDRNKKLEDSLYHTFGWSLKIPWGWEIIKISPDSNFVWMGKEMPFQWIGISWKKGYLFKDNISAGEFIWSWPQENYGSIQLNDYKFDLKESTSNTYKGWRAKGIWETIDIIESKGGPFCSYLFYDEKSDKSYHINFLTHHPGEDKSIFMRQLDLIAKSFTVKRDS